MNLSAPEGVGNAGCPLHSRSRVHLVVVERTRVTTSTPESPGIPARNGFTAYFVLSPVTGLFCHRHPRKLPSANLTPASGRQDHTPSPSASRRSRLWRRLRPPHPVPTFVTMANAPLSGRDGGIYTTDLSSEKQKFFFDRGWTRQKHASSLICPTGNA